jgi:hypothetical protein
LLPFAPTIPTFPPLLSRRNSNGAPNPAATASSV